MTPVTLLLQFSSVWPFNPAPPPRSHTHGRPPGIDDTVKIFTPTAAERRPVPPEAYRVMERNREGRSRGPDRAVLPVSPELLRLLFSRRGGAGGLDSDGEAAVGEATETEDGEGCNVS